MDAETMQQKAKTQGRKPINPIPSWARARWKHFQAIRAAFERADQARHMLDAANKELTELMQTEDSMGIWRKRWTAFVAAGGVTFDEWCHWQQGQQIRVVRKQCGQLRRKVSTDPVQGRLEPSRS
jgi:hypothetical protein